MSVLHPKNPHILVLTKDGEPTDTVQAYAWPGGYPIFYVAKDGLPLCPRCVQDHLDMCIGDPGDVFNDQWKIVGHDANWEDPDLFCEHCGGRIESAYAAPECEGVET